LTDPNVHPDCPGAAERLLVVARDLATARDVEAVAAVTCTAARELTGADGATFVLRQGEQCICVDENAPTPLWKGRIFPLASCVSGWVMTNGQAAVIPDVFADSRVPHDVCRPTPVKSVAAVPVGTTDSQATLGAYWADSHHATADEVAALKLLAAGAALALDNVRLYQDLHAAVQSERDARLAAEAARRAKDELLALVAHELRQPLHASLAAVRVLAQTSPAISSEHGGPAAPPAAHVVVHRQLEQMTRLVEDLVDAASVVYGRVELSLETVHVPSLMKQVTEAIGPLMQERQLQLTAVPPVRPVWIRADAGRIQQVLMNLLMNAAKYTEPGGVVRLSSQYNDGFVTIAVRDNGRGIEPAFLPHIFDLFTRGAGDRAGFGVGLSVARRLIELHQGRIEARSEGPGAGSEFIVMLPTMAAD
jgi:signal transduction histidine kinase